MKRTAEDARWSRLIRERAGYRCQRCGDQHTEKSKGLHACHLFSRGITRTRHDPDNGLSCCYGCHRFIDSHAAEKESLARSILGDQAYEELALRAGKPLKAVAG